MPSKTLKKKYGKYIKKKVKLTKKQKLIGGNKNIIEENIIRSILSRSILDYNVNTGKLLKKYLNNKTKNPHFKRKLKFINKFFLDDGKFTEIPDLIEDIKKFDNVSDNTIDNTINIKYINNINNFLKDHDEYINEYDGYSKLKPLIDECINLNSISPTDKVNIFNYLQELKKSIDENKFTYNIKKFAKNMKYKVNSDIKNVDESLAEMLFYFNKKFKPNKTECSENLTECKIPKHTEELKIQSKIPI